MAKATHYEKSNQELDTRDDEQLTYRLAKSCRRQAEDVEKFSEINDQHGKFLVDCRKDPVPWKLLHEDDVMIASLDKSVSFDGCLSHDVTARIYATWLKWRSLTGVLYDKNIPDRTKPKIYRFVVRPVALYATQCWPAAKEIERRLGVMKMKIFAGWPELLAMTTSAT
ncbi:hypothetical protein Y032_0732g1921 [Ancylostoma ceylanicum]|uniref:Uncharacterized protein n=1 Tax=Ancylostoma ceylanicum TaxID=53326 RepID=A0A016WEG6_9BILA|nr:hypothetical protein Y032_0732g1921 [Ancylostoma ceylanicum]